MWVDVPIKNMKLPGVPESALVGNILDLPIVTIKKVKTLSVSMSFIVFSTNNKIQGENTFLGQPIYNNMDLSPRGD